MRIFSLTCYKKGFLNQCVAMGRTVVVDNSLVLFVLRKASKNNHRDNFYMPVVAIMNMFFNSTLSIIHCKTIDENVVDENR